MQFSWIESWTRRLRRKYEADIHRATRATVLSFSYCESMQSAVGTHPQDLRRRPVRTCQSGTSFLLATAGCVDLDHPRPDTECALHIGFSRNVGMDASVSSDACKNHMRLLQPIGLASGIGMRKRRQCRIETHLNRLRRYGRLRWYLVMVIIYDDGDDVSLHRIKYYITHIESSQTWKLSSQKLMYAVASPKSSVTFR
ncbi:hypothetical protein F4808DRAFT_254840 [Astrocystis sublimbata]|nr:hypothetical protein F4808DRAFT_254840 [Astrocystis sublimbata]